MLSGTLVEGFTVSPGLRGNHATFCLLGTNLLRLGLRELQLLNLALILPQLVLQVLKVDFLKFLKMVPARSDDFGECLDLLFQLSVVLLDHFANLLVCVQLLLQQVNLLGVELCDVKFFFETLTNDLLDLLFVGLFLDADLV